MGVMLLSSIILAIYVSLRSGYPASVAQVQETTVAILASAVATATAIMTTASTDEKVATAFAILGVSTVTTGLLFCLSGRFRLGGLMRFLPYPVVAGFLAGSGWLLLQGALMMVCGGDTLTEMAGALREPTALATLVPAAAFALAMAACLRLSSNPLVAPVIMVSSAALFYALLWFSGIPVGTAREWGWLPAVSGPGGLQFPSPLAVICNTDWAAVMSALPMLVSVPLIAKVGLLLNTSGLELAAGRDIDANAELRITGHANIVAGLFGGASGFTGLGMTLLARRIGAGGRSAGLASAAVMALALPFATELAAGIPLFLAAGLMMMLGGDWAIASRRSLPRMEWMIVAIIVLSTMVFGFMMGIAVGLVCSVVSFAFNYARLPVIRLAVSGRDRRSSTDRSAAANRMLDETGHHVHIIELQNYLFFGTVEQVVGAVRQLFARDSAPRFLILDFRNVGGADSASVAGFAKIFNVAGAEGVEITLCALPRPLLDLLRQAVEDSPGTIGLAADLDHALEACEERLIAVCENDCISEPIESQLARVLGHHSRLPELVAAMDRLEFAVGETLIHTDEEADDIFLVMTGAVKVQLRLSNGRTLRLRTMTAGAVVGEVAFYLAGTRTADVIVERPATLLKLTRASLERLESEDPELAILAHRLFARTLAERLALANRTIAAVNG